MASKKGEKVIDFKDGQFQSELQEDQRWDTLLERVKSKTVEERRQMSVGDTIEFEEEDITIRKVGRDEYQLVLEGSRFQKALERVEKFVSNLTRR